MQKKINKLKSRKIISLWTEKVLLKTMHQLQIRELIQKNLMQTPSTVITTKEDIEGGHIKQNEPLPTFMN